MAKDVEVIVQDGPTRSDVPLQRDLVDCLRIVGPGLYTLVVPYPRRGYRYGIKWKVPPAPPFEGAAAQFVQKARANGHELAKVFYNGLAGDALSARCTVALYVPGENPTSLVMSGSHPADAPVPMLVNMGLVDNFIAQAWRGNPTGGARPPQEKGSVPNIGLQPGEEALFAIPVRFGLRWTNEAPWGIVRLGIEEITPGLRLLLDPAKGTPLSNRLLRPMILMLNEAGIGSG